LLLWKRDDTIRNIPETGAALNVVIPHFIPHGFTLFIGPPNLSGLVISSGAGKAGWVQHSIKTILAYSIGTKTVTKIVVTKFG
jgi:hypothetical protein